MGEAMKGRAGRARRTARRVALAALALASSRAEAQEKPTPPPPGQDTQNRAAGSHYQAGGVHRLLFGSGYRDLWAAPITVEVLDLEQWSGGLTARKKGGGKQTKSLTLEGKDGREWKFRSIDKDPTAVLPELLQETLAARIVQDQISASHPLSVAVVDPLTEAAGIPHVKHRVVVLPDDERLGEFREEFAGMLGTLAEEPSVKRPVTPGFSGYTEVVETDDLEERMDADPAVRIDSRALLRARLLDVLVGDSDRHQKQWDWARDAKTGRFVPVPSDRDLAFVRFNGLIVPFVRPRVLQLMEFDEKYPPAVTLHWQARFLDRRHLADLDRAAWEETARDLRSRITDEVIDDAVKQLPPPYFRLDGANLARRLKARRDALETIARELYELLAREAEVHGTDQADSLQLLREGDGSVEVVLAGHEGRYFRRRFHPAETDEIRVFLKGGDDRGVSEGGQGSSKVTVRIVGGDGNDHIDDSGSGHVRVYDASGTTRVVEGPGTYFSDRPYTHPTDKDGNPERDWGHQTFVFPWLRASRDYGLVLGGQWQRTGFGFRKHPFRSRSTIRAGYSTELETGGAEWEYLSLRADSRARFEVFSKVTALDVIHYYGLGNETDDDLPRDFYNVKLTQVVLAPAYRLNMEAVDVSVGPVVKFGDTRSSPTLLELQQPYGSNRFGQVGGRVRVAVDRRAIAGGRSRGGLVEVEGTVYPGVWSATETFGKLHAEGVTYLPIGLPLEPLLALRGGGEKIFGRYPFHEAASIGGSGNFRGLPRQRYIGDASAWGNAELRLLLRSVDRSAIPRIGVFGLADVGRVFLEGESSNRWHRAFGGGVFVSVGEPNNVVSLAVASSEGRVRFYAHGGFTF